HVVAVFDALADRAAAHQRQAVPGQQRLDLAIGKWGEYRHGVQYSLPERQAGGCSGFAISPGGTNVLAVCRHLPFTGEWTAMVAQTVKSAWHRSHVVTERPGKGS